jgi:hypothetical protein
MDCNHKGKLGQSIIVQLTPALWECLWQSLLWLLFNPLTTDCSHGEWNETASCRAIFNCILRPSVTGPTTGLSNPCFNTQHLLCLVTDCSHGGELGQSLIVQLTPALWECLWQSLLWRLFNPLTTDLLPWWMEWDSVLLFQLHFETVCDWPNYWSVQSLLWHPASSVSCHWLLMWRRNWDRVSLCNLRLPSESVCDLGRDLRLLNNNVKA